MPLSPLFLLLPLLIISSLSRLFVDASSSTFSQADTNQTNGSQPSTTSKLYPSIRSFNQTPRNLSSSNSTDSNLTPKTSSTQIAQIYHLLNLSTHLKQALHHYRHQNLHANNSLQLSKSRTQQLRLQHDQLLQSRKRVQTQFELLQRRLLRYDSTLNILRGQIARAIRDIELLRTKKFWLVQHLRQLDDDLREKGLERWAGEAVKGALNPVMANALVQGTTSVVEPVLEGIERFAEVEGHLEDNMKVRLRTRIPLVDRPFYSGFVTYIVLLCPLVLVLSVLVRVRRRMEKIRLIHVVVLTNFYFAVLCAGCFCATVIGKVDVLLTLRAMNRRVFDALVVLHGGIYVPHVLLHAFVVAKARSIGSVSHVVALVVIGVHCFLHMWRHAARHEDPHVDRHAYLIYTAIFGFVLYELRVKRIHTAHRKNAMTLNDTPTVTQANDLDARSSNTVHSTGAASSVTGVSLFKREAVSVKDGRRVSQSLLWSPTTVGRRVRDCAISGASTRTVIDPVQPTEHVETDTVAARNL